MDNELIRDIYERMGRMEAKLDDVRAIRETADEAKDIAQRAEQKTDNNTAAIAQLGSTIKWAIGSSVPLFIFILGYIFV